jgi:hypothetical protein
LADKIPSKQSAFKPYGTKEESLSAWDKAADDGFIDSGIQNIWSDVQAENDKFFKKPSEKQAKQ